MDYYIRTQIIFHVCSTICVFLLVYNVRSLPDKKTRRKISEIAKKEKIPTYEVINNILRKHFEAECAPAPGQNEPENCKE